MSLATASIRSLPIPHGVDKSEDTDRPSNLSLRFENLVEALKIIAYRVYSATVWVFSASLYTVSFNNFAWAGETAEDAWDDALNYGGSLMLRCHRVVDPHHVDEVIEKISKDYEAKKKHDKAEKPHKEKKHKPAEKSSNDAGGLSSTFSDLVASVRSVVDSGVSTVSQATGLFVYSATSRRALRSALNSACAEHEKKYYALASLAGRALLADSFQWMVFKERIAALLSDCQKQAESDLNKYVDKYSEAEIKARFDNLVTKSVENLKSEIDANATSYLGAVKRGVLERFFGDMCIRRNVREQEALLLRHKWLFDATDVIESVPNTLEAVNQFERHWFAQFEAIRRDQFLEGESNLISTLAFDLGQIHNQDAVFRTQAARLCTVMGRLMEHTKAILAGTARPGGGAPQVAKSISERRAEVISLMSAFDPQVRLFSRRLLGIDGETLLSEDEAKASIDELTREIDAWRCEQGWFMEKVGGWLSIGIGIGWKVLAWPSQLLDGMGRLSPKWLKGAAEWVGFASESRKYADGVSEFDQYFVRKCIDIPITACIFVSLAVVGQFVAKAFGYIPIQATELGENASTFQQVGSVILGGLSALGGVSRFIDSMMPESWSRLGGLALVSATWWQLPKWHSGIIVTCVSLYGASFFVDFSSYADLFEVFKLAIAGVTHSLSAAASLVQIGSGYWKYLLWIGGVLYSMDSMRGAGRTLLAVGTKVMQVSGTVASGLGKSLSFVKKKVFS